MKPPRLPQNPSAPADDVPDGFYLVRLEQLHYRSDPRKSFFELRLKVLEPEAFAGRLLGGRLYCTTTNLTRLSWFLRGHAIDPQFRACELEEERPVHQLDAIVNASHQIVEGQSHLTFAGFAPACQWTELAPFLPPGAAAA